MARLICLLLGYGFGLFQTAYLIGRIRHIDIRTQGSKNAGTTNALRVMGKGAGACTFLGDFFKALLVILLVYFLFKKRGDMPVLAAYAGIGATLGHNYPFYMGFRGGKGIAVMAGVIAGLGGLFIPFPLVGFLIAVIFTGYISLGSLLASALFLTESVVYALAGLLPLNGAGRIEFCAATAVLCALAWWRHRENMKRLIRGNENSLFKKKAAERRD